jgi:hypothetical protein
MTESTWLNGSDADEMLAYIAERFTPRRWRLLATAFLRRRTEVLPAGPLTDAIDFVETHADELKPTDLDDWHDRITNTTTTAIADSRRAITDLVQLALLDNAQPVLQRANQVAPAFPLFAAASRYANQAIEQADQPVILTADAIRNLFAEPSRDMLERVRDRIELAMEARGGANRAAATAMRLKQQGDEIADRALTSKNKHHEYAKAEEIVGKVEEQGGYNLGGSPSEKATQKAMVRFLWELVGNPFGKYEFDQKWRTETVVGLARTIEEERAFDRMPILADALLDADCDSEAVLRHLRGTEKHVTDKSTHLRGCWVIDLILRPHDPLFPQAATTERIADEPTKPTKKSANRKRGPRARD